MKITLDLKYDSSIPSPNCNFPIAKIELTSNITHIEIKLSDSERTVAVNRAELLKALTALS